MAKRTVIEDSDDDDDCHEAHEDSNHDIPTGCSETTTVLAGGSTSSESIQIPHNGNPVAQGPCEALSSAEKSGSGSTGRLQHELREAHQTLIETTPHAGIDTSLKGLSSSQEVLGSPGVDGSRKRKRRSRSLGDEEIGAQLPAPSSSAAIISPSKIIAVEAPARLPASREADLDDQSMVSTELQNLSEKLRPAVLVPERPSVKARADTANEALEAQHSDRGKSRKKLKRQKNFDSTADDSASDEADVGLPLERYQPRPSRTRSGRADDDLMAPVDFSKRPEKVGRDTKKAGKKKSTNLEIFEDHPAVKSTDGGVQTSNENDDILPLNDLKEERSVNHDSDERDNAFHTVQSDSREKMDAEPRPPKKPRGRPKKVIENAIMETSKSDGEKTCQRITPDTEVIGEAQEDKSKFEIVSKVSIPEEKPANVGTIPCKDGVLQGSPPSKAEEIQPKTPDKPSRAGQKGPDKHSPINNGKVAYRVGLSKRARIEPLLRIVRK